MRADFFSEDTIDFIKLLNQHEVNYVIVGGIAVIYHGYSRGTGDVDFFYGDDDNNVAKLYDALNDFWECLKTNERRTARKINRTFNISLKGSESDFTLDGDRQSKITGKTERWQKGNSKTVMSLGGRGSETVVGLGGLGGHGKKQETENKQSGWSVIAGKMEKREGKTVERRRSNDERKTHCFVIPEAGLDRLSGIQGSGRTEYGQQSVECFLTDR